MAPLIMSELLFHDGGIEEWKRLEGGTVLNCESALDPKQKFNKDSGTEHQQIPARIYIPLLPYLLLNTCAEIEPSSTQAGIGPDEQ